MPWLKDVAWPAITAVGGAVGAFWLNVLRLRREERKDALEAEFTAKARAETDHKSQIEADVAQSDSLTRRFMALMDGYEHRIRDLTDEVIGLRAEVKNLRQSLDIQNRICSSCPGFRFARENQRAENASDAPAATAGS